MIISGLIQQHDITEEQLEQVKVASVDQDKNHDQVSDPADNEISDMEALEAELKEFDIDSLLDELETLFRDLLDNFDIGPDPSSESD